MKKQRLVGLLLTLLMVCSLVPSVAFAAGPRQVATGDELVAAVTAGGDIQLTTDITVSSADWIYVKDGQTVTLDLNGYTITKTQKVFMVQHGTLNVTGAGTIQETADDGYGAIMVTSTATASDLNWANVNVGKDVTLRGWAPLFINQYKTNAYGVNVVLNGTCISPAAGTTTAGHGIYINGQIKDANNCPNIQLGATAVVANALGTGIYAAGYAKWTIAEGASITGEDSAIAIKNGELTVNGGTLHCTGSDATPTDPYGNGVNPSGAALQIESNAGYGTMKINIVGGNFVSDNSCCIYEYAKDGVKNVNELNITGGSFTGVGQVFKVSDGLKSSGVIAVSGGTFGSDVSTYLAADYHQTLVNGKYVVMPAATGVTLSETAVTLEVGATKTLTATVAPATSLDAVAYTTGDAAVATVDATGKITAVAAGTTTVTATVNGKTATCAVTVYKVAAPVVPTVDPTKPVETVEVGTSSAADAQVVDNTVSSLVDDIVANETVSEEVMSTETVASVKAAVDAGKTITAEVQATTVEAANLPAAVVAEVDKLVKAADNANEVVLAQYLDLSVMLKADGTDLGTVNKLDSTITFKIAIPEALKKDGRTFSVICVHENADGTYTTQKLPATLNNDGTLSISTDKFSTYALVYEDVTTPATPATPAKPTTPNTGDTINLIALCSMLLLSATGCVLLITKKARGKHQA